MYVEITGGSIKFFLLLVLTGKYFFSKVHWKIFSIKTAS